MIYSLVEIAPGETRSEVWVISGLYQFERPGRYTVRVEQLEPTEKVTVLAADSASVRVLPFDAARLEARCEELFRASASSSGKALYSVRHDIVLPYLDWMVREQGDEYAIRAMGRIGTPRAQALVKALAARKDWVGDEARHGLKIPLDITWWDIIP